MDARYYNGAPDDDDRDHRRAPYKPAFHQCAACRETVSPQFVKVGDEELCQACWRKDQAARARGNVA